MGFHDVAVDRIYRFLLLMLALDLGLLQRRPHVIGVKEALTWFAVWVGLAMLPSVSCM